jgi:hypothetical protein
MSETFLKTKQVRERYGNATRMAALVGWITLGSLKLGAEDIANVRLPVFAILPQLGGRLLLVARR